MRGANRVGRRCLRAHATGVLLLLPLLVGPSGSDAADLSVYGKLPAIENVVISGDGSRLAYLRTQGDERVVSVFATDGHKLLRMVKVGHQKVRWIEWADADHLLITESHTVFIQGCGACEERYHTWVFDARDGKFLLIPRSTGNADLVPIVFGQPIIRRVGERTLLFVEVAQMPDSTVFVRIDLQTGDTHVVE